MDAAVTPCPDTRRHTRRSLDGETHAAAATQWQTAAPGSAGQARRLLKASLRPRSAESSPRFLGLPFLPLLVRLPRRSLPLVKPRAVRVHLLHLGRGRVRAAARGFVAPGRRAPAGLDAVVGVVGHLELRLAVHDVAKGELPLGAVAPHILELARPELLIEARLER